MPYPNQNSFLFSPYHYHHHQSTSSQHFTIPLYQTLILGSDLGLLRRLLLPLVRVWGRHVFASLGSVTTSAQEAAAADLFGLEDSRGGVGDDGLPAWVASYAAMMYYACWLVPIWVRC